MLVYSYYPEELFAEIKCNNQVKELSRVNGQLRDKGAKVFYPLMYSAVSYLKKLYGENIEHLTISEAVKKQDIKATDRSSYVFIGTATSSRVLVDQEMKEFLRREGFSQVKVEKKKEVKGLSAYRGKVVGKVRVVKNISDMKKVDGEIVVARETIIDYTPHFKNALAIVTDLGGINCHASITAREYKIPCIVGTKYATGIFKDRDLVEVDANKGVARKLK